MFDPARDIPYARLIRLCRKVVTGQAAASREVGPTTP